MKKIISCLTAGIISLSTVTAFAFTDTENSEYKSEITELTSLGIINGFEDGTFRPDNKVTRAEAAKMFAVAKGFEQNNLGYTYLSQKEEFSDFTLSHWAFKYTNYLMPEVDYTDSDGNIIKRVHVIDGFEDSTFRPDENVTIVQLLKMAIACLEFGYYEEAQNSGGYPDGIIQIAEKYGFSNNIDISNINAAATRGQAAKIISNMINIPVVTMFSFTTIEANHTAMQKYITVKLDGTNSHFPHITLKTMLETNDWDFLSKTTTNISPLDEDNDFYISGFIKNISGNTVTLLPELLINTDGSSYVCEQKEIEVINNGFKFNENDHYYFRLKKQENTWVIDDYARI